MQTDAACADSTNPRSGESPPALVERVGNVRMLRKVMDKAVLKLATQRQFNRKVELNPVQRQLKAQLEDLNDAR